jgi:outer membrane protein assembly factor BamE (lipoprotein component of BamABCDE complex)
MHMVAKIRVGSSTRAQVTELLGTPWRMVNYGDCNPIDDQEMWEYLGQDADGKFRINLEFDEAGVVRIISKTPAKGPVLVLAAAAKRANPTHQH